MNQPIQQPAPNRQWTSLEELANTPEFQAIVTKEFPGYANIFEGSGEAEGEGFDRRRFMQLMGASMALAGIAGTGCQRPDLQILAYSRGTHDQVPGLPTYYATTYPRPNGGSHPVVVESNDGRPTKIEGNPEHPASRGNRAVYAHGGTDVFTQASVLDLYHPDRSRRYFRNGVEIERQIFDDFLAENSNAILANGGQGLAFLAEDFASPSLQRVREHIQASYPQARWYVYEPVNRDTIHEGTRIAFGRPLQPTYRYDRADFVVSLDADFLCSTNETMLLDARRFNEKRSVLQQADRNVATNATTMNRLYVAESMVTVTGMNADHRLRLPATLVGTLAVALARELGVSVPGEAPAAPQGVGVNGEIWSAFIAAIKADLGAASARGKSIVLAGRNQPAWVHALCFAINAALGNLGQTVELREPPAGPPTGSIAQLRAALSQNQVNTLVILGGNPVYNAPADLNFGQALDTLRANPQKRIIHLGMHYNETAEKATWHVPMTHYLEQWGDTETAEGIYCAVQPLIAPLYAGSLSPLELVARIVRFRQTSAYDIVRDTFMQRAQNTPGCADQANAEGFRRFLHRGFLGAADGSTGLRPTVNNATVNQNAVRDAVPSRLPSVGNGYEVTFHPHPSLYDGRYFGNGWLQELPEPATKLVWDNAAIISPATARELSLTTNDLISIEIQGQRIERIAVFVLPGHADKSVTLHLGHGQPMAFGRGQLAGQLQNGGGGFNVYPLRTSNGMGIRTEASLTKLPGTYRLVSTQDYSALLRRPDRQLGLIGVGPTEASREAEREAQVRELIQIGTLADYRAGRIDHSHDHDHGHGHDHGHDHGHGHGGQQRRGLIPLHIEGDLSRPPAPNDQPTRAVGIDSSPLHQWGMVIDLNSCIACSACMVACQSENNVPIVGKDEVRRNREMHWIRVDRYFIGSVEDPRFASQPLACVHCERAPCETVCPVNAAVHSPEGLNLQVYNRCVGTRYCSNNCPFKVRRFNWFDYNQRPLDQLRLGPLTEKGSPETLKMQRNPDVTIRMRGVMEKCTYCVQRIERGKAGVKIAASRRANRDNSNLFDQDIRVPDGTITPACAQACPTQAITFGNLVDRESKVYKLTHDPKHTKRNYTQLDELNIKPRTSYMVRLTNPNETLKAVEDRVYGGGHHGGGNH
jgi:MoCo/4Fe-4S cofactor protein with predicted Tat translocation signal